MAIASCIIFLFGFKFFDDNNDKSAIAAISPPISLISDTFIKKDDSVYAIVNNLQNQMNSTTAELNTLKQKFEKVRQGDPYQWLKISVWTILFIVFTILLLFHIFFSTKKKPVLTAALTVGSLFSLAKVFDSVFNKVSFLPDSQIILYQRANNIYKEGNSDIPATKSDTLTFGTFATGKAYVDSITEVINMQRIKDQLSKKDYKEIILAGGVDIRKPIRKVQQMYGDNQSLALARAIYVKNLIIRYVPQINERRIIALPGAATNYHNEYDSIKHEQNRKVFIYAKY